MKTTQQKMEKNETNTKLKLKQKNLKLTMAQDGGAERVWVSPNAVACRSGTLWASWCAVFDGGEACHELQGVRLLSGSL
jgi:hypothetical protein